MRKHCLGIKSQHFGEGTTNAPGTFWGSKRKNHKYFTLTFVGGGQHYLDKYWNKSSVPLFSLEVGRGELQLFFFS